MKETIAVVVDLQLLATAALFSAAVTAVCSRYSSSIVLHLLPAVAHQTDLESR